MRHGLTQANVDRLYYGSTDLPLCSEGVSQLLSLKAAGGYPAAEGMLVVTSGMTRTEQTLATLWGAVAHETWPELREMGFGDFELHGYETLKNRPDYQAWLCGDMERNKTPGGESVLEVRERVLGALRRMLAQERDVLAVVHGGTIVHIMDELFPDGGRTFYAWQPNPGFGYEISINKHEYRMIPR